MIDLTVNSETLVYADMEVGKKVELETLPGVYAVKQPYGEITVSNSSDRTVWVGIWGEQFSWTCFPVDPKATRENFGTDKKARITFRPSIPQAVS